MPKELRNVYASDKISICYVGISRKLRLRRETRIRPRVANPSPLLNLCSWVAITPMSCINVFLKAQVTEYDR